MAVFETGQAAGIELKDFPSRSDVGKAQAGHFRAVEQVLHATDRAALLKMLQEPARLTGNTKPKHVWPVDQVTIESLSGEYRSPSFSFLTRSNQRFAVVSGRGVSDRGAGGQI